MLHVFKHLWSYEKAFIFLLFNTISISLIAQSPDIEWSKTFGGNNDDYAKYIVQTNDSGYIVAGYTNSTGGDVGVKHAYDDFWVIKLTSSGSITWKRCYGGSGIDDAYCIQQTYDSGYVIAGLSSSKDGNATSTHSMGDFWVIKTDRNGTIIWQKEYGGSDIDRALSIQQTKDSGYIVTGSTKSNDGDVSVNHGLTDIWVIKLSQNGTLVWQKSFGGTNDEEANSVVQASDGGYAIAGFTRSFDGDVKGSHATPSTPFCDYWILKLNDTGKIIWQKCYGGSSDDIAYSIKQTTDGGYIVAGETDSRDGDVMPNHGADYWILKLNDTGKIEWQKCLGGIDWDEANSISQTKDGGFVIAGFTQSKDGDVVGTNGGRDAWIIKLNSSGYVVWEKCYGSTTYDEANCIQQTLDGGYIFAGETNGSDGDVPGVHTGGTIGLDYWIVKLSSTTDVDNLNNTNIENIYVYPTLTNGIIKVSLPDGYEHATFRFINLLGQYFYYTPVDCGLYKMFALKDMPAGMYILQIINNGITYNFKIDYKP